MRALGVDVGGTKLLAAIVDEWGARIAETCRPTGRGLGPYPLMRLVADVAAELGELSAIDAAGLGFPGLVDVKRGVVRSSVMLDGWSEVPLRERVGEALGVVTVIDNDVNAAAFAELAARGDVEGGMLFVAVGTGIGGAFALGGELLRGAGGVAGEIGNTTIREDGPACWCGRRGCLNMLASGTAIEQMLEIAAGSLSSVPSTDARLPSVVRRAGRSLGLGLANAVNLLNPALVVIGGGVAQLDGYFEEAVATAREEAFPEALEGCSFERARAGYEAGAVGAGLLAIAAAGPRVSTFSR